MASLKIRNICKSHGSVNVIHGMDLDIDDGEFVVFVGPSGCGKSTLLRMIAGLEEVSAGTVEIDGKIVNEVAPSKRAVAMVFQTYALYPHMTVYKNMAFGLKQANTDPAEIDRRVKAAAETLQITDYLDRVPKNLSGGQRQRVAIGRAIVRNPEVFLFDEPLSNLDAALRVQTRIEIARLHKRLNTTMIYVTHDQIEAMTLADKIVVLKDGLIAQVGRPMDIYNKPANLFVAGFIGSPKMNFLDAKAENGTVTLDNAGHFDLADKSLSGNITIGMRPEHLLVTNKTQALFSGRLELVEQLGEYALVHLLIDHEQMITVKMDFLPDNKKGDIIYLGIQTQFVHVFDQSTGKRIDHLSPVPASTIDA